MQNKHTFAICAYKKSPYLEECIKSVLNQVIPSDVILVTSTPNEYIFKLCNKYNISYYINEGESGITQDWNFAYSICKTTIVTITHQDDIYFRRYTEALEKLESRAKRPLIFFTDYFELRSGRIVKKNKLLNIKRIMLLPLRIKMLQSNVFVRRRILSFGSPICCPSVAFFKDNLPEIVFKNHFRTNEDWEAWEMISKIRGQFLYCKYPLMAHRIHADSETTAMIQEYGRMKEDLEMYTKFWPKCIAIKLAKYYSKSEASNRLD